MGKSLIHEMLPPWANRVQPYVAGKPIEEVERELGRAARKLASNENPLGPSPAVFDALKKSLNRAHLYPDSAGYDLRVKLAERLAIDKDQLILGAGSTELIHLAARTFLSPEDEGITSDSTFLVYRQAIEETGAALKLAPLREMAIDLHAIQHAVTPRTKVIYLANPNNPTGTMFTAADFNAFLAALPPHVLVVLDEAYYEYVDAPEYVHPLEELLSRQNILILRTFSKVYGLAGLRMGYGISRPELIAVLDRVRMPFNTSRPAQAAALAALGDQDHVKRSTESNRQGMRFLTEELSLLGVRFTASFGNFLLVDTARDCEHDFLRLLEEGVIVRPMKLYGFPTSFRVTIGTQEDNEVFLEALKRVIAGPIKARDMEWVPHR